MSPSNPRARHNVLGIVALSLFAALFTRLWYLQVLTTDEYDVAARANRTREVIEEAPRGRILDRNGNVLVDNRRTIQVRVDYQDFSVMDTPEQSALLRRLAAELNRDQLLIYSGELVANDPGMGGNLPECEPAEEEGATEEGSTTTTTTEATEGTAGEEEAGGEDMGVDQGATTTTTTAPCTPADDEATTTEAGEEGAATEGDEGEEGPDPREEPPAGVATGAENPDGQQEVAQEPPAAITEDVLRERIEDPRFDKFKPVPIASDVSEQLEVYLRENAEDFPTVTVERITTRNYRYGALAAHLLGYVGAINAEELAEYQNDEKTYENDDQIGKTGVERGMEMALRGTPGRRVYEVDARNRPIREVESLRRDPVPGSDVFLTIDINLQYLVEKGLAAEIERRRGARGNGCPEGPCDPPGGASVSLNPQTGEVLAMASYPTYDPNLFIGGISSRDYDAIASDELEEVHHKPLVNRAIAGQYPPGSTFKLFSAYAGLATGQIESPEWQWNDDGTYEYSADCNTAVENNCSASNAGKTPHGAVNLAEALTVSSDTYFYRLGDVSWRHRDVIGEDATQQQMRVWGLGQKTGIALPGEAPGRIPDPAWLREFSEAINDDPELAEEAGTWTAGKSGNTMIGQGDVLATPLQLANGYAALGNGGTVYRPQFVYQVTPFANAAATEVLAPEAIGQVPFQPGWREALLSGFEGVTKSGANGRGTAATSFQGFDQGILNVAGKTGTAQTTGENDTSLFTAFAPVENPTIAMATVVEFAGFGSDAAVPVTRRVMDALAWAGGDLAQLNGQLSPYRAPIGGWFDVEAAMEEFQPQVASTPD